MPSVALGPLRNRALLHSLSISWVSLFYLVNVVPEKMVALMLLLTGMHQSLQMSVEPG